jgi:hypothetical protein
VGVPRPRGDPTTPAIQRPKGFAQAEELLVRPEGQRLVEVGGLVRTPRPTRRVGDEAPQLTIVHLLRRHHRALGVEQRPPERPALHAQPQRVALQDYGALLLDDANGGRWRSRPHQHRGRLRRFALEHVLHPDDLRCYEAKACPRGAFLEARRLRVDAALDVVIFPQASEVVVLTVRIAEEWQGRIGQLKDGAIRSHQNRLLR